MIAMFMSLLFFIVIGYAIFQFIQFYGYSTEVNGGYELKISMKIFSTSCIVTSDEMKERLDRILTNHVMLTGEK